MSRVLAMEGPARDEREPPADGAGQPARTHPLQSGKDPASGPLRGEGKQSGGSWDHSAKGPASGRGPDHTQTRNRSDVLDEYEHYKPGIGGWVGSDGEGYMDIEPKVFLPHDRNFAPPKAPPRKVEVERLKRLYEAQDLVALLREAGVDDEEVVGPESDWSKDEQLAQTENAMERERMERDAEGARLAARLPLEAFDDAEYEVFAPEEWIRRGTSEHGATRIPARALYGRSEKGEWRDCFVTGWDPRSKLFDVEWAALGGSDQRPRFHLCFYSEDPCNFAARLAAAYRAESSLRYNLYVDCMPTDEVTQPDSEQTSRIISLALNTYDLRQVAVDTTPLINEVAIDFMRTMNRLIFDSILHSPAGAALLHAFPMPEAPQPEPAPQDGVVAVPEHNFPEQFSNFSFATTLTQESVKLVMWRVRDECNRVLPSRAFSTNVSRSLKREEFETLQASQIKALASQLRDDWTSKIAIAVRNGLRDVGKGWYNLDETESSVYEFSKLKRLMRTINFMMQDSLRFLVIDSLTEYARFIERACEGRALVDQSTGAVTVRYPVPPETKATLRTPEAEARWHRLEQMTRPPPLFVMNIAQSNEQVMLNREAVEARQAEIDAWVPPPREDEDEEEEEEDAPPPVCPLEPMPEKWGYNFQYRVPADDFIDTALALFDRAIKSLQEIKQIEPAVMNKLFWPHTPLLACVHPSEGWVRDLRRNAHESLREASAPLEDLLHTLDDQLDFLNMDTEQYLQELREQQEEEPNPRALVKVVESHKEQREALLGRLPSSVHLGLFVVQTSGVRDMLAEKHTAIAQKTLDILAELGQRSAAKLIEEYHSIYRRLQHVPRSIEELTEIRAFMEGVDDTMARMHERAKRYYAQVEVLDRFRYKLPGSEVNTRWKVMRWPKDIAEQMEKTSAVLGEKQLEFSEEMAEEQSQFEQTLQSLQDEVGAFASYTNLDHVESVAQHVRKIEQRIKKAEESAHKFNSREALFGRDVTEYSEVAQVKKAFQPYANLWLTAAQWMKAYQQWMEDPFPLLDDEKMEKLVGDASKAVTRAGKYFRQNNISACAEIADTIQKQVDEFKPHVPLIRAMRNPGMRARHWEQLSTQIGQHVHPDESFTMRHVFELELPKHREAIIKMGETAAKQHQIEKALNEMWEAWQDLEVELAPFRDTGTFVLHNFDDVMAVVDEHITMVQAMAFSTFKGPFEEQIDEWERKLKLVSEVLEEWITCQRAWMELQPIFESEDINKQLPTEGKRFATVDKHWRTTMQNGRNHPNALKFCASDKKLLDKFRESNKFLEMVQKGLSDYLETKRTVFARFYFLSDAELLEILSESRNVHRVQPHLRKCFEGIKSVTFSEELLIENIKSSEGEVIPLQEAVDPKEKNVEQWLLELEREMLRSVRQVMMDSIVAYATTERRKWILKWPGMCVLNGSQTHWTQLTEEGMEWAGVQGLQECYDRQLKELDDMVELVRGKLKENQRVTIGALAVIDVHARDVLRKLIDNSVSATNEFLWISQMRYYWEGQPPEGDLFVQMVSSRRPYGYEYLGNSFRLVITPLTDKCYLTCMGALQMILGGAPAGPAGTGKTETVKDLSKALAMRCVVFNCSDQITAHYMAVFFKGLASCGAWACFDEFNRINIEVLSVIAQQIVTLQNAVRRNEKRLFFEDTDILVDPRFSCFITMNPGYAGRTELPDNLKALFRPVAMMVPDYALIGEIMLFAFGFRHARECAKKMVSTFKLCSEQLSAQHHYDYGMRAVKTVITAAGNLKRESPDMDELVLLLRALQDVNVPKFLAHDLPLFDGIISDLFPGRSRPQLDYGSLMRAIKLATERDGLQSTPYFTRKVIQLYETICVRHGLMVVGPSGGGKSSNIHVLARALTWLKEQEEAGVGYERVQLHYLNPKSVTMGQLYGEFDPNTREWQDGVLVDIVRHCAESTTPDKKWVVFDGPVDALWIENMNTVLDDNKKLCLSSGQIIALSNEMTMMFEPEDLAVASPATVSRCGMVFMEPTSLGVDAPFQSWLERLPSLLPKRVRPLLQRMWDAYVQPSLLFLRRFLREPVPTIDNNLGASLCRILDCYLERWQPREDRAPPGEEETEAMCEQLEAYFFFALVWSVGATTDEAGRARFSAFLRQEACVQGATYPFPEDGTAYDYVWDAEKGAWAEWLSTQPAASVDTKLSFSEIVVPTADLVRNSYLLNLLVPHGKHVMMTGDTGTGKTVNIARFLGQLPDRFTPLTLTFSAQTSANETQDLLDSKMEKRKRGVFGPTLGKRFVVYVDDLNMPAKEEYGAQPPIELLRQWMDYRGWYDRKTLTFRNIVDVGFVTSMGPPGGGRNAITARYKRHFNIVGYVDMSDKSKAFIFTTILGAFLRPFEEEVQEAVPRVVQATVSVYNEVTANLLPTPAKSHYTFNLRDMSKVMQGVLMSHPRRVTDAPHFLRLWVHECRRVFQDRLVSQRDRTWFDGLLQERATDLFPEVAWDKVVPRDRLLFGDYMVPGADPKVYTEVDDMERLVAVVEEYLSDYNAESQSPMKLVLFLDAIEHVSRVSRVLRQPGGNALLLGVGGSGRQSLTRLATFMADYALFQVEVKKGYGKAEWREDVKSCLLQAGLEDKPVVFLFNDTQIVNESMLEDVNNILNSGDVPNLYGAEEMDQIVSTCRIECQRKQIPPTKLNIFAQYLLRVRRNIHVVLCMSPMGEAFRRRLRMFPSLVNCCTIDWFTEWPTEALRSVAMSKMTESEVPLGDYLDGVVTMFQVLHQTVERKSAEFFATLRRHNYVTPTSYLELLSTFAKQLGAKRQEVNQLKSRLTAGLSKLSDTKEQVAGMQQELTDLQPQLEETQVEVEKMMKEIAVDKEEADKTRKVVETEEKQATQKAEATQAIKDDAQRDLDEALPALDEALKALKYLNKKDLDELRALKYPPEGVKLSMEASCIMFEVPPVVKSDPDNPGKKLRDYWEAAQTKLLKDAKAFLQNMTDFDKDGIPDKVIAQIQPYIDSPEFQPSVIERASKACTAICMWVRAMYKYHNVARSVEPKRQRLREAQAELDETLATLKDAKDRLSSVEERITKLEADYNGAVERKEQLAKEVEQCKVRLDSAQKLIGGLGGEEKRWTETVATLGSAYENLVGDILVSAGTIGYLGAFTADFRDSLCDEWRGELRRLSLPHSPTCDIRSTLADPVKVREWQVCGLPTDSTSTENGIIMDKARRWPLMIDPQGQANRYVKNLGKEQAENGLKVGKMSDPSFQGDLEKCVRFGRWMLLENIGEELEAALEPVLQRQTFRQSGQVMMRLGDANIPYSDEFRFFMTTKLPNPHYPPEVSVKVSLLNFTITPEGLEEQLLGTVIEKEMPELEQKKNSLVVANARMTRELHEIEDKILQLLYNSQGNILDDTELINTLDSAKKTSEEIKVKMREAEETEAEIDTSREGYKPVAFRGALLFFCIADLATVDPMYQYSLPWFKGLFIQSIDEAEATPELARRLENLNSTLTLLLYRNVCRSLFERHKLLFSFLLCIKIMQGDGAVRAEEWRFLISSQVPPVELPAAEDPRTAPNPDPSWIEKRAWTELTQLATMSAFRGLAKHVAEHVAEWKALFDAQEPEVATLPGPWHDSLDSLQRMCVLRCLRADKMMEAIQNFVEGQMGREFIESPPFDLAESFKASSVSSPLIFVLSAGSNPRKDLDLFAEQRRMTKKLTSVSLGQGQDKIARRLIEEASQKGGWVLLENCHLMVSWMPDLEQVVDQLNPDSVHKDFRLWLTSMPSKHFPVSILQNGVKMTREPPKGLRANIRSMYFRLTDQDLDASSKPHAYKKLLFGLTFFHAVVIERKKFGPLGWNIPYEFNESDFAISKSQLQMFLDEYEEVPYKVIQFLTAVINYGGRITDDKDQRTIDVILRTLFTPDIMEDGYKFSPSGIYHSPSYDEDAPAESFTGYIDSLPRNADPEVFGMHDNANITSALNETYGVFDLILSLQPRASSGGAGSSRDDAIMKSAQDILHDLPPMFDEEQASMTYPVNYYECMNTVIVQEVSRYNRLLEVMHRTLVEIQKAINGQVVMSSELEAMGNSLFNQWVPALWEAKAYPSLKPLAAWVQELHERLRFIGNWLRDGVPPSFWISGFFFPQAFLTGTLQNFARKYQVPIDSLSFNFDLQAEGADGKERPEDGCVIYGLFLEGARWDSHNHSLTDPKPKELFSKMPMIHLLPMVDRKDPQDGIYRCPVYKVLSRRGTLSTTGHSTNFVFWIEVPVQEQHCTFRDALVSETNDQVQLVDCNAWVKAGVAAFCSLRY